MLSIIVPTVNRQASLVKLVRSIQSQNFPVEELEIIVVYNSLPRNKKLPIIPDAPATLKQLIARSPGVNHARNTGIIAAQGDILLFIDDDCVLQEPYYLARIVELHRFHQNIVGVGGPYKLSKNSSFWDRAYALNMNLWLNEQRIDSERCRTLLGGNASYKAHIFNDGLRFTPGIKYGGSETPLNFYLFDHYGAFLFSDNVAIEHQSQMGFKDFSYKAYMQGKGFAWQTKIRPQQIQKGFKLQNQGVFYRLALWFYSFLFMIGFRTSILERRSPVKSFFEELGILLRGPFYRTWLSLKESYRLAKADYEP